MTRGVIHNHFGSSNGLISAVVEVGFTELTSAMGAIGCTKGQRPGPGGHGLGGILVADVMGQSGDPDRHPFRARPGDRRSVGGHGQEAAAVGAEPRGIR
jgi:hypothetical protein